MIIKTKIDLKYFRQIVEKAKFARTSIYGRSYNVGIYSDDVPHNRYDGNFFYLIPLDPTEMGRINVDFNTAKPTIDEWNRVTLFDEHDREWTMKFYSEIKV